ncbi:MAG: L-2-hydroxyglutarate oxidase [Planctomycetota bacterium]|nr:L-2-hydroxyglutarate oxidase [Planctomycetota bacterium]
MPSSSQADLCVIGAGIVGLATARALLARHPHLTLVLLEAEEREAAHQTGHNSGVIHSGLYYRPGSLKAELCARGREKLLRLCEEEGIDHKRTGKLVLATREEQRPRLDELERRGRANGLVDLERLGPEGIREREPHARGVEGLWVGETGIVDFGAVARHLASALQTAGADLRLSCAAGDIRQESEGYVIETPKGEVRARWLLNCAGVQADRVARRAGVEPGLRIAPFRGEYMELRAEASALVNGPIYPVPDPAFPFLGVHFTTRLDGSVEAGPNAVLALSRNGYHRGQVNGRDLLDLVSYGAFWKMAARHWRSGLGEVWRSYSKAAFTRALQELLPELTGSDLQPGGSGVRAQALDPDGTLADDFRIVEGPNALHVLSAPSPAATACLAIGDWLANRAEQTLDLGR